MNPSLFLNIINDINNIKISPITYSTFSSTKIRDFWTELKD